MLLKYENASIEPSFKIPDIWHSFSARSLITRNWPHTRLPSQTQKAITAYPWTGPLYSLLPEDRVIYSSKRWASTPFLSLTYPPLPRPNFSLSRIFVSPYQLMVHANSNYCGNSLHLQLGWLNFLNTYLRSLFVVQIIIFTWIACLRMAW